MDKKIKVILTQRWWDANRAKTLTDKGNLGKALKAFEPAFDIAVEDKGGIDQKAKQFVAAEQACAALHIAAAATAKACVTGVHGDTQWVLKNSFVLAVDEKERAVKAKRDSFNAMVNGLKVDAIVKNAELRKLLAKHCAKEHSTENLEFLLIAGVAGKRDPATFKAFVKGGAPKEVNLPAATAAGLKAADGNGTLERSPFWDTAVKDIEKLMAADTLKRFKEAVLTGKL